LRKIFPVAIALWRRDASHTEAATKEGTAATQQFS